MLIVWKLEADCQSTWTNTGRVPTTTQCCHYGGWNSPLWFSVLLQNSQKMGSFTFETYCLILCCTYPPEIAFYFLFLQFSCVEFEFTGHSSIRRLHRSLETIEKSQWQAPVICLKIDWYALIFHPKILESHFKPIFI